MVNEIEVMGRPEDELSPGICDLCVVLLLVHFTLAFLSFTCGLLSTLLFSGFKNNGRK